MAKNKIIQKAERESLNLKDEQLKKLKSLFPDVIADGKISWDKLRATLGESIDSSFEKFTFSWAGKSDAIKNVLIPSKATLRPDKKESIKFDDSENIFIEGDNLEILKLLQNSYFEKIKMIYIDPPYNTGNDFVYKDDFKNSIKNYHEQTGQTDDEGNRLQTNTDSNGRFHSDWLTMMYPRLKLAWNLLKDDGVIFISIDDNEVHYLRVLLNEIFGSENFIGQLTVLCNPKGRSQDKYFATNHEYILVFAKSALPKGSFSIEKDQTQIDLEYTEEDESGKYRLLELRNTHREFGKHNRKNLFYPLFVNPKNQQISLENNDGFLKVLPLWDDGFEGCWTWDKKKAEQDIEFLYAKETKSGTFKIYRKSYSHGADRMLKTILNDKSFHTEKGQSVFNKIFNSKAKIFQSPKSVDLLKTLISTYVNEADTVLDFFAGSGTLAEAVLLKNQEDGIQRKFMLIQIPEPTATNSEAQKSGFKTIAEITKERIRRVIKGYGENPNPLKDGFKVFKLDESNYPENQFEFDPEKDEKENGKAFKAYLEKSSQQDFLKKIDDLDLIYENIIKEGLCLNSKIDEIKIGKSPSYKATDEKSEFYICLDQKIPEPTITELKKSEYKDKLFIAFDNALDDSSKANLGLHLSLKTI